MPAVDECIKCTRNQRAKSALGKKYQRRCPRNSLIFQKRPRFYSSAVNTWKLPSKLSTPSRNFSSDNSRHPWRRDKLIWPHLIKIVDAISTNWKVFHSCINLGGEITSTSLVCKEEEYQSTVYLKLYFDGLDSALRCFVNCNYFISTGLQRSTRIWRSRASSKQRNQPSFSFVHNNFDEKSLTICV